MAYNLFTSPALVASKQNTQAAQVKQEAALRKVPGMNPILDWAQQPQVSQQLNDIAAGKQVVQQPAQNFVPTQKYRPVPKIDPNSATSGMDAVTQMYTSPEEEERLRKASSNKQKMLAIADAFRHIGNIYHTNKYAPAQKFNQPWAEELTRYERGKAVRDAANARYYAYQQQKAAQDAKQKQWEAEYGLKMADAARKAGLSEAQIQNWKDRLKADIEYKKAELERKKKADEDRNALNEKKFGLDKWYKGARIKNDNRRTAAAERRTAAYINRGGGRGGGGKQLTLRGKKGFYSKGMGTDDIKSFYNQTYDELKKRGLINEGKVLEGLPADIFGKKSLSQSAIRQAVDNALMQYPEVGDILADTYEFDLAPREYQQEVTKTPSRYVAPGNTWAQPGLPGYNPTTYAPGEYDSDEEDDWDEYIMD